MSYRRRNNNHFHLCKAIERGDKVRARKLLSDVNVNVNVRGNTPLHWAIIESKDLDIITMLLDKGANIHAKNCENYKPLYIAIHYNKTETALLLIKKGALGENLNSLLLMAIVKNNLSIIKMLIDHGMQYNPSVNFNIYLNFAISRGHAEIIEYIIPHCRFLKPSDKYISRKLVMRSGQQYRKCIEVLFKWNFTIHLNSHHDEDFIYAAVENRHLPIVLQLLKLGINVNIANSNTGNNLLTIARINKHHDEIFENHNLTSRMIQLLLEYNENIEAVNAEGLTPLLIACDNYNYGAIKCLLDHDANVNHTDSEYSTSLHIAIKHVSLKMIEDLIKYEANVNILDRKNRTPLQNVIKTAVEDKCLSYKINSDSMSSFESWKYVEMIKILVSQGIKLKTAGLTANNYNSNIIYNPDGYITIDRLKYSAIDVLQLNVTSAVNADIIRNIRFPHDQNSIGDIRELEKKCKQEIAKMKIESIGIIDMTFYDLLKQNIHLLGTLMVNKEIQKILKEGFYNEKFPLYIDIVRSRLRDAKLRYRRYILRKSARKYFRLNINQGFPDDCIDRVLSYLSIKELETFIGNVEHLNG